MVVDITQPTSSDSLSPVELELYHLIMDYRATLGLDPIPLSEALTITAGRHALDTAYNIWEANLSLPSGANLHSWSDAPYYSDHRAPEVMWYAPSRINVTYPSEGYEISAAGQANVAAALQGWQSSSGHNVVITNSGGWSAINWNAIGIGVEFADVSNFGGRIYHVWFGATADPAGGPDIIGTDAAESLTGTDWADQISAGDGADTITAGGGNDVLVGGTSARDLRDVIYGGAGNDNIDGGYGNDELRGDAGDDTIVGGFGVDEVFGGAGNDQLTGQAWSDLIFGGDGMDFINGGFGFDRVNGGNGADQFFHIGVVGHGSDWIQDYTAAQGDVLLYGGTATRDQFQVNFTETADAGDRGVEEAFVIYRPTGQILWALVDGQAQDEINLSLNGNTYDLLS